MSSIHRTKEPTPGTLLVVALLRFSPQVYVHDVFLEQMFSIVTACLLIQLYQFGTRVQTHMTSEEPDVHK